MKIPKSLKFEPGYRPLSEKDVNKAAANVALLRHEINDKRRRLDKELQRIATRPSRRGSNKLAADAIRERDETAIKRLEEYLEVLDLHLSEIASPF